MSNKTPNSAVRRRSGGAGGDNASTASSAAPSPHGRPAEKPSHDGQVEEQENVKVICRVRPFNQREIDIHNQSLTGKEEWEKMPIRSVIEFDGPTCIFLDHEKWQEKERFGFDACLWSIPDEVQTCANPFANQAALMEDYGKKVLLQAWKGYNTCFFAYGQTGSGKTYSMMGPQNDPGLIPRVCEQLFADVAKHTKDMEQHKDSFVTTFRVSVKYIEIYNEHVSDLLFSLNSLPPEIRAKVNSENMKVRSSPATGVFVDHLTQIDVESWQKMVELIELGNSSRHTAATKMNERSSRSHAIFKVELRQITTTIPKKQFEKPTEHIRESTINLVDLAGSERNKKTGATGDRLKEAASINKSLSCLKGVIDVLVENSQTKGPKKRPPYRDSTLTSILMDSLGGNSKTYMLICLSPHKDNFDETLQTLRYGARARQIVHTVKVNENSAGRMMLELEEELDRAKAELEKAQTAAKPEVIEQLNREIQEQEEAKKSLEEKIAKQQEELRDLEERRQEERKKRELRALTNLSKLTKARVARSDAQGEYEKLRDEIALLKTDKEAKEQKTAKARAEQTELQKSMDEHKGRSSALDIEIQKLRRQNATLEGYRRDLQKTIDDQESELANLKNERIAIIMRARYHSAQTIVEYKHMMEDQQLKHNEEAAAIQRAAEKERNTLEDAALKEEAEINAENEKLQQELDAIEADTTRIETERGAQVEKLEKELKLLEEQRRKRTTEGEARIARAKEEWQKKYDTMEAENQAEYDEAEQTWKEKQAASEQEENRVYEESVARWAEELNQAEETGKKEVSDAKAEGERASSDAADAWRRKLDAKLAENAAMRKELVKIRDAEKDRQEVGRRVQSVLSVPLDPKTASDEAKQLRETMKEFIVEFTENAPSMYLIQQLLREEINQTRCGHAPVVAEETSKPASVAAAHLSPKKQHSNAEVDDESSTKQSPSTAAKPSDETNDDQSSAAKANDDDRKTPTNTNKESAEATTEKQPDQKPPSSSSTETTRKNNASTISRLRPRSPRR